MRSKNRTLPLTELANNLFLPDEMQRLSLRHFVKPRGKILSYNLSKSCAPEALGATGPLFPFHAGLTQTALLEFATRHARGDLERRDFNWPIIEALSRWRQEEDVFARHREIDAVPLIGTHRARLVCNAIVSDGSRPTLLCLDPRHASGLVSKGIFVVQSLIHHLLREQYPDLAECDIALIQFPQTGSTLKSPIDGSDMEIRQRTVALHRLGAAEPMSWSELKAGIATTYRIFAEVLAAA